MHIFLDDQCFISDFENIKEKFASVELMIQIMEMVLETTPLALHIPADFLSLNINGKTFGEVLYAEYSDSSTRDLVARFEQIVRAAELVPNNIEHGPTAVAGLRAVGCGGLITNYECEALAWWQAARMYKIMSQAELRLSIRSFFVLEKLPQTQLSNYSEAMFQSLYFHCPIQNIKNLGVKYANNISIIIKHLSYLNDQVTSDFKASSNDRELSTRAGNQGVNMSPESHATRNNRAAMQQREVKVLKVPITCEWHTKVTPRCGRIHFYPWAERHLEFKKDIGSKLIIGIICKHLD